MRKVQETSAFMNCVNVCMYVGRLVGKSQHLHISIPTFVCSNERQHFITVSKQCQ